MRARAGQFETEGQLEVPRQLLEDAAQQFEGDIAFLDDNPRADCELGLTHLRLGPIYDAAAKPLTRLARLCTDPSGAAAVRI